MAGGGKTACALELAWRHERDRFTHWVWHKAPDQDADIRDALAMLDDGRIRAEGIVTHHVPFDDVEEAFRLARTGEALKVVIDF
jgi:threonine dehydrogenase-like Zn-dependent dehydrogenase